MNTYLRDRYAEAKISGIPLAGAHQGNAAEYPENTLAAFRSAIDLGVDIIECDVHPSADGELVVIHDPTLDRTTNGHGLVMEHDWAELQRLDAGNEERLPLLHEVCELTRGRAILFIELKQLQERYAGLEEHVVGLLQDLDMLDHACIVSFNHATVRRVRELEPRIEIGINEFSRPVDPAAMLHASNAMIFAPNYQLIDPELVEAVHAAGSFVATWTADDPAAIGWCRHCGVDSILTNRPQDLMPVIRCAKIG